MVGFHVGEIAKQIDHPNDTDEEATNACLLNIVQQAHAASQDESV